MHLRTLCTALSISLLWAGRLHAQTDLNNFSTVARGGVANTFVTDYQVIGINPANLGRAGNARVALTIGEFGIGAGSESLKRSHLSKFINNSSDRLTPADKLELSRAFTSENTLNFNIDLTPVALSVEIPVLGGFAFSSRQRASGHLAMNKNTAELLFFGKDAPIYPANFNPATAPLISDVLSGTAVQTTVFNEYNVAFGRRILSLPLLKLSGGVGYRYIQGIGIVDVRAEGNRLEAFSSLSPQFDVDYGSVVNNPSFNLQRDADKLIQPVGRGHGYDVGVAAEVGKMLRFGLSATDLGQMTWKGNLLTANDQRLKRLQSAGVNSYEIFNEIADLFAAGTDSLLQYRPAQERKAALPAKLRFGAGVRLNERLEIGADVTTPLNEVAGNLPSTFYGLGVDVKPLKWIRLSTGISSGGGYSLGIPVGFAIATKVYELGLSTRDVRGLLSEDRPYYSAAFGFLRFKIGQKK